tara:strand:+ start:2311 stop:3630 length:1320 start_codon:yes stop_codon:yes gene_type:complete
MTKIFNNQFIICNHLPPKTINDLDLKFIKLNKIRYLYYKNLNYKIFNNNKHRVILIGFCLQSDPSKKQSLNHIFNNNIEDIELILSTLVGNYIIIYKNMIYKDIGNLYKLFLYNNNNEILISNNALAFKNILKLDLGKKEKFGGHHFKYCPPGKSCFSMVESLYNSQNININGKIFHNKLIKRKILKNLTLDTFIKMHMVYSCQIINNLYKSLKDKNKKLFLTLTGGRDSRMILAIVLYLKIPFKVITLKLNPMDVAISKEICKKYNLNQTIINLDKFKINNSKKKEWENIVGEEFVEKDNEIIQKQILEKYMNDGDCIIFGNGPEWSSICPDNIGNGKCGITDENHISLKSYMKWIEKYHEESIPLKTRLFLEVRVGSWLSSIQHSYDMCSKIQRFCFPISEKILANSFSFGSKRNKSTINHGVIQLLIPELNTIRYH